MLRISIVSLVAVLAGCSSTNDVPRSGSDVDAGVDAPASSTDVTLSMKLTVAPGEETHRCQLVQLPKGELWVSGLEHHYTKGSHHFLMYKTTLKSIPKGEEGQTECTNGDEGPFKYSAALIYASQTTDGKIPFPDGVGMHLESEEVFLIQSHYINPSKTPLDATVALTFKTTTAEKVKVRAAPFLFYQPWIYLSAKAKGKSGMTSCGMPADITVLSAFSHYHQRGTKMTVWRDPSADKLGTEVVYSSNDWENPEMLTTPIALKKGEHLRFNCEYDNTAGETDVIQGPRTTNEMCVFVGIYYPEQPRTPEGFNDFWACGHERRFTEVGTKNACFGLAQCLQTCPATDAPRFHPGGVDVGLCWQKCVADACPGALNKVFPLSGCQSSKCAEECKAGGDCLGCITTKCEAEFNSCAAHTCPTSG